MSKEPKQFLIDGLWDNLNRISSTRDMKHLKLFYERLRTAEVICEPDRNTRVKAELAKISLHFYELNMECQKSYFIPLDSLERMRKNIHSREILQEVLSDSKSARVLAFMYMYSLGDSIACEDPYLMDSINSMLTLWLGITPAPNTYPDFAATITSIYGPGTYELFRADVREDSELPKYLYRNNIPLLGTNITSSEPNPTSSIDLPSNFG